MSFRDNLRKRRRQAKISQEELGARMEVSRQTVSKWENGEAYPSTRHILMLAEILDCSMDELIGRGFCGAGKEDPAIRGGMRGRLAYFMVGAVAVVFLVVFGVMNLRLDNYNRIDGAVAVVAGGVIEEKIDAVIGADGYEKSEVVGYGIRLADETFFVKCGLEEDGGPCAAIVYFCKKEGGYFCECEYSNDPDYWPEGEYYKIG